MDKHRIIYWISTAVMCAVMLFSANMYLTNYDMVAKFYTNLGFPTWIIYPSAILKILGVVVMITGFSRFLKEWVYAAFFFDMVLAFTAHQIAQDGGFIFATIGLIALVISRYFWSKITPGVY